MVLVKVLYSLISTGTEKLVATGKVPKDMYERMAVPHMEGHFDFPVKYGYSSVGRILSEGHPLDRQIVHLMCPHQQFCQVDPLSLHQVPQEIPPQRATLASNLETIVNAIWDSGVSIGDRVLVVGFGMIGALLCRILANIPGLDLHILDKEEPRIKMIRKMGFSTLEKEKKQEEFDIAFHTSASSEGLTQCLQLVGREGKVVELSWYGTQVPEVPLGQNFHYNRVRLIASQVSHIPGDRSTRWDYRRRKDLVFQLLKDPLFDQHISHIIPFEEAPDLFDQLRKGSLPGLGYCLKY